MVQPELSTSRRRGERSYDERDERDEERAEQHCEKDEDGCLPDAFQVKAILVLK